MHEVALNFLKKIEDSGFKAYIVGGYVRDFLIGKESNDIDICTSARPSDIKNIFKDQCMPVDDYGSVIVIYKNTRFEVTTFRKEISYVDNRRPLEYIYIDNLDEDIKRRDFTINTICMDKDGNIVDLLDGRSDLAKMEINTVGDSKTRFTEDSLRILRAVRFATVLDFKLSEDTKKGILEAKHLLKNLSYERKKEELNLIFGSIHVKYGVKLLIELGLDLELDLINLKNINNFDNLIGTWALLDVDNIYPFTKNEKDMIQYIREAIKLDNLDIFTLYKYGSYINSVCADIKGIDKKMVALKYQKLPIKERKEINITGNDIMNILNKKPGDYLKDIIEDIEKNILLGNIENNYDCLKEYVSNKYLSSHI